MMGTRPSTSRLLVLLHFISPIAGARVWGLRYDIVF
jgi:hypothetical protein